MSAGSLHHWFKGSKSKDGKPGWVQSDGSPCANEPGETKTPKCYSSARLAALKRKGKKGENLIKSADRRKREKDPGQQSKSGAAKPTNVKTFAKGRKNKNYVKPEPGLKETMEIIEGQRDKKGKGSGKKDACYHKVKSRYDVWPSAYASGALVKCRKVGAANWGNKSESVTIETADGKTFAEFIDIIGPNEVKEAAKKCWPGYEKKGTKKMFGKTYNNCVKKEENEIDEMIGTTGIRKADPDAPGTYKRRKEKPEKKKLPRGYVKFYDKHGKGRIIDGKKVYEDFEKEVPSGNIKKLAKKAVKRIDADVDGDVDSDDPKASEMGEFIPSPDGKKKIKTKPRFEHSDWRFDLDEKLNLKKADMGDVVTDFYKSDAPQFRGKSKEKRREMAVAAKLSAMRGESFEIDPKKHRQQQRAAKIRNLAQKGATKGEKEAAARKIKGPKMFGEDWQKVNKSDKTDGMSPAAVKAYRRENPGSKLKTAVTGDPKPGSKDAKRRKSFCARSKGQQDMHNIDCSKTPDKPVCKARRRWKC